jgi:hypothetical protein
MAGEQNNQLPIEARPIEDLSLQEYLSLLDKQINSATTPQDIHKLGITDNTCIQLHSDNPQELLKRMAIDMENPELFTNYEPLPQDEYKTSEDNPRRVFRWNSQFVQIYLFPYRDSDLSIPKDRHLRFMTSTDQYPAGFSREGQLAHRSNEEVWNRYGEAKLLAETKERATVVNHFLRYCDKSNIKGTLHLKFAGTRPETQALSKLKF